MPQTEPMTPDRFAYRLQDFARGLCIPEFKNAAKAMAWYDNAQKAERDEWEKLIAQRDRVILEATAERVCKDCGLSSSPCLEKCEIVKVILGEESTR